jgi:hypothetical protein
MTQDVRQWLAEIKNLQQKLDAAHRERDEAYDSAANWRNLYETEARQRRADVEAAQQKLDAVAAELHRLQAAAPSPSPGGAGLSPEWQQQVTGMTVEELRTHLMQALVECDRLAQALTAEQESHAKTRQELTAALGDTIDQLARTRAAQPHSQSAASAPDTEPEQDG